MASWRSISLAIVLFGCKSKTTAAKQHDAAVADVAVVDADVGAPELADYPQTEALHVVEIPHPRDTDGDRGGPVIAAGLAIVSGSGFGFAAIDYARGAIAWMKPAGARVAPPIVHGTSVVLVGDCASSLQVPEGELLLGCLRVVATTGSDEAFFAVHGKGMQAFVDDAGPQALYDEGERVRWVKGTHAVSVDLVSGAARVASAEVPPLVVVYKGKRWEIGQEAGRIVARGKQPWQTEHAYTAIVGVRWVPSPLLRVIDLRDFHGSPEALVIDMDATGSLHAATARPTPGVALLGRGAREGATAFALRTRSGVEYVAGYAPNAMLVYVHALPHARAARDAIGAAVAEDAVVVFHDGVFVTVLPELSAPPTAPGADSGSSQNPTP